MMHKILKYWLIFTLLISILFTIEGCLSLFCCPKDAYNSPQLVLRSIEAKYGKWYLLILDKKKEPEAMAVRIETLDTLLLFKGRFRLARSTQGEQIFISQNSIPNNFFSEIYIPALSVPKFANGREYLDLNTNQKISSYGAFLNVDRIFSDNQWCKFIIVDDLSEGYIFTRNDDKFFGFTNKECLPFTEYSIFSGERDYYSLIQTLKQ